MNAEFLSALFGDAPYDARRVSIFTLPDKQSHRFENVDDAAAYAHSRAGDAEVYFGLGLIAGDPPGRGRVRDIAAIGCLWADIDILGPAHGEKPLPPTLDDGLAIVRAMPRPPSAIVDSGHGLHAYWLLSEPWVFESDVDRAQAAALARGWHQLVCDSAAARGWVGVENLGDLTRVLRVPGTFNRKGEPAPVRLVEFHPERRWHADDLEQFTAPAPSPEADVSSRNGCPLLRPDAAPPAAQFALACAESPRFAAAFRGELTDITDTSRSGQDLSMATIAALRGWSDQEIADAIIAARRDSNANPAKAMRSDYIDRTITRAHAAAASSALASEGYGASEPASGVDLSAFMTDPPPAAGAGDIVTPEAEREPAPEPEYQPPPTEGLPAPIREIVRETSEAVGVDRTLALFPALCAAASAIGNSRAVFIKAGWIERPVIWAGVVARSGSGKSPAARVVMGAVEEMQRSLFAEHAEAMDEYKRELAEHKRVPKNQRGEEPEPPTCERVLVSDATVEALAPVLRDNPRGVLVARDELGGWLRSFNQYKAGLGSDAENWLSMFDATPIIVDRKTSGTIYVPDPHVSVYGTIQPGALARALGEQHVENGLAQRLLLAEPPSRSPKYTEAVVSGETREMWARALANLCLLKPGEDQSGTPRAKTVEMTPEAKAAWVGFHDEMATEIERAGDAAAGALSKSVAYAARVALVLHLADEAARNVTLDEPSAITEGAMRAAADLMRWAVGEWRRVVGEVNADDGSKLIAWIDKSGGRASPSDLSRGMRRFRGDAEAARAALETLVGDGLGSWETTQPGPKGGAPKEVFVRRERG